ncbi:MAG: DUF4465 domain-containing protein [Planctomycetales bacterium]|nr:DUF4465 domain-containing protein [Planctomycetales bacterium]
MKRTLRKTWKWCTPIAALAVGLLLPLEATQATVVDFVPLESQWDGVDTSYDNGSGDYNTFHSRGATFNNYHEHYYSSYSSMEMHYWDGWAYSNRTDTASTGTGGQYTAIASPAGGQGDPNYYGVAYCGWYSVPTVSFAVPTLVQSAYFTNNAYAYHSMLNGDSFAKKFGGVDETDEDWFLLTIAGFDAGGAETGTVDFHLADYHFENSADDYIVDDWTLVDLTGLGDNVSSLQFTLTSSDTGAWGMNTPAYFAMDNLTVVPEPSTLALLIVGFLATLARRRWRRG